MHEVLRRLERFVALSVRERGARYFAQRRVEIGSIEPDEARAFVLGTRRYSELIVNTGNELDAACTCEYFTGDEELCKHIWAVLLALSEREAEILEDAQRISANLDLLRDLKKNEVPETRGAKPLPRTATGFTPAPPWRTFLQNLERRIRFEPEPAAGSETPTELLYVIDPVSGVGGTLATYGRFRKKNGELGAPRKVRITEGLVDRLDSSDRELAAMLFDAYESTNMRAPRIHAVLPRLAATGRLYYLETAGVFRGPLHHDERVWSFEVAIDRRDDGYHVSGRLIHGTEAVPLRLVDRLFPGSWFLRGLAVARIEQRGSNAWLEVLQAQEEVTLPLEAQSELAAVLAASPRTKIAAPPELNLVDVEPQPKLVLVRERGDSWQGELRVMYGDDEIDPSITRTTRVDGQYIRRRPDLERGYGELLTRLGFRSWSGASYHILDKQLGAPLMRLLAEGWKIELEGEALHTGGELQLEISSGIDWFDLNGGVQFDAGHIALPRLLESIRKNESIIRLEGGGVALVDPEWAERLGELASTATQQPEGLRFRRAQVTLIDALFAAQHNIDFDRDFTQLRERLQHGTSVEPRQEPAGFGTELRPYQRVGLGWLHFLRDIGFGGCLADDMGLGKTVQALALIEGLRQEKESLSRPSLVVAPRSLMFNWKAEAARFAPNLRVIDHHGIDRVKDAAHLAEFDLILTTYATLQRDIAQLAPLEFEYVILDEAQSIRNPGSQSAKAVKSLRALHRLALSGTPIENHLGDLWSIFDFLNPGMLGNARTFSKTFGGKTASPEARERLSKAVAPFILRRTKQMVLTELPEKDEQTLWVELSDDERRDYDELREHYRRLLLERVRENGLANSKMYVLEALLRLRQAALHPALLSDGARARSSAKLEALESELEVLIDSGHKALVFSQFVGLLDLVQERVDQRGFLSLRLDGRTRDREAVVKQFQEDDRVSLMLVSLKAGGVGLNLTAADYVFLLDPWWNPAAEAQAIDRAYRIGQQRPVTAVRIVASDTVEEKILELQQHKRELAASIIQADEGVLRTLDLADLEMLLS